MRALKMILPFLSSFLLIADVVTGNPATQANPVRDKGIIILS